MYERVWMVMIEVNHFSSKIFVRATEERLRKYIDSELPDWKGYRGATDEEVEAAKLLRLPIYCY